jgi:peptidoglycan/LPS O-acetylase OafA/YrhL
LRRIAELDGIRGVAIAAILTVHSSEFLVVGVKHKPLYYALYRLMATGWLGVDIFFVLSGFLITTILLEDNDRADFWSRFYLHRSLRILPAFAVVFGLTIAAIHFLVPETHLTAAVILPALFFTENWTVLNGTSMPMLPHLWSLAVEEQFYLVWPQIVRRLSSATVLKVSLGLAVASELLRVILALNHVGVWVIYAITPTRIDGLALGAALAAAVTLPATHQFLAAYWRKIALASAFLLVASFVILHRSLLPDNVLSQILAIPVTILLTAMLIYGSVASTLPAVLRRALANPALTYLGRRSYGLYLIHLPIVFAAWQNRVHGRLSYLPAGLRVNAMLIVISIAICLALTEISWRLVESPAQSLRRVLEKEGVTEAAIGNPWSNPATSPGAAQPIHSALWMKHS